MPPRCERKGCEYQAQSSHPPHRTASGVHDAQSPHTLTPRNPLSPPAREPNSQTNRTPPPPKTKPNQSFHMRGAASSRRIWRPTMVPWVPPHRGVGIAALRFAWPCAGISSWHRSASRPCIRHGGAAGARPRCCARQRLSPSAFSKASTSRRWPSSDTAHWKSSPRPSDHISS